jgi:hypothetical protein
VIGNKSLANYSRIWKAIFLYTIRIAQHQSSGTERDSRSVKPPVTLSASQLHAALEVSNPDQCPDMELAVLDLVDALLMVNLEENDFGNVVTSAMGNHGTG